MTSHFHLIISNGRSRLEDIIRDYDALTNATKGLKPGSKKYSDAVTSTLGEIAEEAQKVGSKVNKLLTKTQ